ncbi:hypothetical protein FALBO_14012 [Fusarium albosuccineum]|uniref:Uncharacterized protein n=1 Tax=Fusarium albosuccineum TaxID=1237068 RepID=A0A8H4L0Y3_9HYPO|nr:hypothetical protein FALBO_14012 [Fusarium albosuccineum]
MKPEEPLLKTTLRKEERETDAPGGISTLILLVGCRVLGMRLQLRSTCVKGGLSIAGGECIDPFLVDGEEEWKEKWAHISEVRWIVGRGSWGDRLLRSFQQVLMGCEPRGFGRWADTVAGSLPDLQRLDFLAIRGEEVYPGQIKVQHAG